MTKNNVIDCVELAKENFYKYQLSGPTKIKDTGEELLRLYSILEFDKKLEDIYFKSIKNYLQSLYGKNLPKYLAEKFEILNEKEKGPIVIDHVENPIIIKLRKHK